MQASEYVLSRTATSSGLSAKFPWNWQAKVFLASALRGAGRALFGALWWLTTVRKNDREIFYICLVSCLVLPVTHSCHAGHCPTWYIARNPTYPNVIPDHCGAIVLYVMAYILWEIMDQGHCIMEFNSPDLSKAFFLIMSLQTLMLKCGHSATEQQAYQLTEKI